MAQQTLNAPIHDRMGLNTGDSPERGDGLRTLVTKINAMFTELYTSIDDLNTSTADLASDPTRLSNYQAATTGASPVAVSLANYQTRVTTGGTEGSESLTIGDGTGAVIGQRKLITLVTLTEATDEVALDDANISQGNDTITAVVLDAEGEFILLEWQGASWEVIVASTGVVAVA